MSFAWGKFKKKYIVNEGISALCQITHSIMLIAKRQIKFTRYKSKENKQY